MFMTIRRSIDFSKTPESLKITKVQLKRSWIVVICLPGCRLCLSTSTTLSSWRLPFPRRNVGLSSTLSRLSSVRLVFERLPFPRRNVGLSSTLSRLSSVRLVFELWLLQFPRRNVGLSSTYLFPIVVCKVSVELWLLQFPRRNVGCQVPFPCAVFYKVGIELLTCW